MKASASNQHLNSIRSLNNNRDAVISLEAFSKLESMSYANHSRTRLCNNLTTQSNLQYLSTRPYMNQTAMLISTNKDPN